MKFTALLLVIATVNARQNQMTPGLDSGFDGHFDKLESATAARQASDRANHNKAQSDQAKADAWRGVKPAAFGP